MKSQDSPWWGMNQFRLFHISWGVICVVYFFNFFSGWFGLCLNSLEYVFKISIYISQLTTYCWISVAASTNGVFTSPEVSKTFDFTSEERIYDWYKFLDAIKTFIPSCLVHFIVWVCTPCKYTLGNMYWHCHEEMCFPSLLVKISSFSTNLIDGLFELFILGGSLKDTFVQILIVEMELIRLLYQCHLLMLPVLCIWATQCSWLLRF